jgi:DNA-binding protein H-NS
MRKLIYANIVRLLGSFEVKSGRLKAIREQIEKLEQEAERLEHASKPGIVQLQAIISKYRLSPADVEMALKLSGNRRLKRGVPKGTRLQPKYQNPDNPKQTWAGRGLKPAWMVALLHRGAKLTDLSI